MTNSHNNRNQNQFQSDRKVTYPNIKVGEEHDQNLSWIDIAFVHCAHEMKEATIVINKAEERRKAIVLFQIENRQYVRPQLLTNCLL